jgi:hypothetical protein
MSTTNLPTKVLIRLLNLRGTLDSISQVSYSFSQINKRNPMELLTEESAVEIIDAYDKLITSVRRSLEDDATKSAQ